MTRRVTRAGVADFPAGSRGAAPGPRVAGAPASAHFGAVTFVHRFGAALNANLHFHCAIIDGLFSPVLSAVEGVEAEGVRFHAATALTEEDVAAIQREVRTRVLRLFKRRGY